MGNSTVSSSRNYGIDLLRLLSMFFVVILHVLGQGGALNNSEGTAHQLLYFFETAAYCAVNIFAMISGYVCFKEEEVKYSYSKYLKFWLPVFIYSFGFTLAAFIVKPQGFTVNELVLSAFPITANLYWYASSYTALFFLIPWINKFIRSLSNRQFTGFTFLLVSLFTVYTTFANLLTDIFKLAGGYSVIFLIILYFIGAWAKRCNVPDKIKSSHAWLTLLACTVITFVSKIYFRNIGDLKFEGFLLFYSSLTLVLSAFCYIVIFSKIKFGNTQKKLIAFFSPAAFGVYLIHCQPVVWNGVFKDAFVWITEQKIWLMPVFVLGSALAVFTVCLLIDRIRITLFKVLKIDNLLNKIIEKSDEKINKLTDSKFNIGEN